MRTKEDEVAEKAGWMNEEQLGAMMKQIGVGILRVSAYTGNDRRGKLWSSWDCFKRCAQGLKSRCAARST